MWQVHRDRDHVKELELDQPVPVGEGNDDVLITPGLSAIQSPPSVQVANGCAGGSIQLPHDVARGFRGPLVLGIASPSALAAVSASGTNYCALRLDCGQEQ